VTKEELLEKLRALEDTDDPEAAHIYADRLLLQFIGDVEVEAVFNEITRWFA
jgi:hypothetical protein